MFRHLRKYLNNQDVEIRVRLMFFLEYAVIVASALGTACMIILNQPIISMIPNFILFFMTFFGLYLSKVKKNYDLATFILILGCANIAVPWMFFSAGGNESGMHIWFLFSVVVTCMMSKGRIRLFMSIITIIEDLICICIGQFIPETVTPLIGDNAEFYDQLQSYAVVCVFLTIMLISYISTYDNQQRKMEQQSIELTRLMRTDALTGLLNRRAYYDEINSYKTDKEIGDLVLVSMDVNGLKRVNDSFGHSAGDDYLCAASKVINQVLAQYGLVFRIGGDEFMAMLHCSIDNAKGIQKRINECIASQDNGWADKMAIAVGVVCCEEYPDKDITEIEKLADEIMYKNKAAYYKQKGIERRIDK